MYKNTISYFDNNSELVKRTCSLFLLTLFFLAYFLTASFSQTCEEKEEWIEKIKRGEEGANDCESIRNALEKILEDCLLTRDSFYSSLWPLYLELGFNFYSCGPEEKGINLFNLAIKSSENSKEITSENRGRIYRLLAQDYHYLGDNQQAFDAIIKAIEYFEKDRSDYLSSSYTILANLYTESGDYDQSFIYIEKADKIASEQYPHDFFIIKDTKAEVYGKFHQYDKALREYRFAKTMLEKMGVVDYLDSYAKVHSDIGQMYLFLEDYTKSRTNIDKAQELFKKYPNTPPESYIVNYSYLAQLQKELSQYDHVETTVNKALSIADSAKTSPYYPPLGVLYYLRGGAYAKQEKYDKAFEDYQHAIKVFVPSFQASKNENPILSQQRTGHKINLRTVLNLKAQAYQQRYQSTKRLSDLEKAHDTYLCLDTLITQTRQSFKSQGSKYFLQKNIVPIYENAIEVALDLYKATSEKKYKETAHQLIGRNKAIILIEGLQNEKVKFATIPNHLIEQEIKLKKHYYKWEIAWYEAEEEGNENLVQEIKDSLFTTKKAYEKLIQIFEKDYPKYYQLKHDYYPQVRIKDIQSKLESNRAVVEFFVGEKMLFASVISKDQHEVSVSLLPDNFEELCFDFIAMTNGESTKKLEQRFSKISYELYQYLFESSLKKLNPGINRLTIIPDDILLHLSFDALLTAPYNILPENWADEKLPYFIRKYSHNQVYANSLLFNEEAQDKVNNASKGFLGFGLEYFDYTIKKEILSKEDSLLQKRNSGPLPFSDDEVLAIQKLMGGEVLINKEATKQVCIDKAKDYEMLHFSMHGYADEESPLNSALIFAKVNEDDDHLLRVADIYSLNLRSSLIYLNACQTNYATLQKGEGMSTISRAFAYAGCPSIVASLWNIPDKSSKEIATSFYENIKNKENKDVALRNAKLSYLENVKDINRALPNFWSQTVVIGNPDSLNRGTGFNKSIFGIIGAGVLLFLLLFFLRRNSGSTD